MATKRIVLCEIVGNESKIIERNVTSALPILDGISISYNGSDNTHELIKAIGEKSKLPVHLENYPWKNFEENRSQSFQALKRFIEEQKWEAKDVYGLLLDADMLLEIAPEFDKQQLTATHYNIWQYCPSYRHYNVRLVRCDLAWHAVSVTHEYWAADSQQGNECLTTLLINDVGDGCCKDNKFSRDIYLLTEGLKAEPNNIRYMFYLANSYRNFGESEKAIEVFRTRIERGGWSEEVWYAYYMIGSCYESLRDAAKTQSVELERMAIALEKEANDQPNTDDAQRKANRLRCRAKRKKTKAKEKEEEATRRKNDAIAAYWEAFNYRPIRAEPIYFLAKLYRNLGMNNASFAKK